MAEAIKGGTIAAGRTSGEALIPGEALMRAVIICENQEPGQATASVTLSRSGMTPIVQNMVAGRTTFNVIGQFEYTVGMTSVPEGQREKVAVGFGEIKVVTITSRSLKLVTWDFVTSLYTTNGTVNHSYNLSTLIPNYQNLVMWNNIMLGMRNVTGNAGVNSLYFQNASYSPTTGTVSWQYVLSAQIGLYVHTGITVYAMDWV